MLGKALLENSVNPIIKMIDASPADGARVTACPICERSTEVVLTVEGFAIRECAECQHRFVEYRPDAHHLAEVYSEDYFLSGGVGYPDYTKDERIHRQTGRHYGRLLSRHATTRSRKLLDVGAAAGFIMQGLAQEGWHCQGIEPCHEITKIKMPDQVIHDGQLDQLELAESFDAITMIQVLPHLTQMRKALANAARWTGPDGLWLIETWNFRSMTARVMKTNWHEYAPPSVLHWFSPHSLQLLCRQYGMSPIATGRRLKRLSGSHLKAGVAHALRNSFVSRFAKACASIVPDNATLPYPSEDLFWMLFRKQHDMP